MVQKIIDYLPIQRHQKTSTFHRNVSIIAQNVDALKKITTQNLIFTKKS